MTSRDQIFSLEGSRTISEVLPEIMGRSYSRIPIFQGQSDEIVKVLHLRDLLEAVIAGNMDASLSEISHDVEFVPQYQPIDELFDSLRNNKQHVAVVVDEYGVLRGIATLEDLMEELVGEIYDESDSAPEEIKKISEHEIAVDGGVEVREVEKFFNLELSGKPTDTVNFWILMHTERIPDAGESFTIDGVNVTVDKASRRRIIRVVITLAEASDS